jgi:hypothetical protein
MKLLYKRFIKLPKTQLSVTALKPLIKRLATVKLTLTGSKRRSTLFPANQLAC